VRGDLDSLAASGKVHRVRGGAIPRLIPRREQPFEDSISSFAAEKVAIAQAAAALLEDGETVLLDVGTTAAAAGRAIAARTELSDVVVFTNGLKTALELEPATPRITVVVLGAEVLLGGLTFTGSLMAFGKLQELISGRPITYPGQKLVNAVVFAGAVALGAWAMAGVNFWLLAAMLGVAYPLVQPRHTGHAPAER